MKQVALGLLVCGLALLTGCQKGAEKPKLYFYTWADYIDPEMVKAFEAENDCTVVLDYFDSNESMLAKIKSGNTGYDVILPSTYMVAIMQQEGLVQKLDGEKIPNAIASIDTRAAKLVNDEKLEYSVPYYLGITGFGYNKEQLKTVPDSWRIFEQETLQGRMALLDDMRETLGAALMTLGFDPNTTDQTQLEAARDLVVQWKANIAKFGVDDVKQGLANGEFYVVHGYSGDMLQFTLDDPNIGFAMPKEGTLLAIDHFVIPTNATNPQLAHQFINFMCDPKNAAANMEFTQYYIPVSKAVELLPDELRNSEMFRTISENYANAKMIQDLGENNVLYSRIWDQVKAAHH
ncbi:MAG: spermidine/putrescine ABC transporter substrate-binding protein [Planctomycetia bacterium]|nr:spermidine/putrescine ABC transporter substrate-binding protein [Planctomycetia bacterium]